MIVKHLFIFFSLLITFTVQANSGKEILEKTRANYLKLGAASLEMNYELYKGYSGDSLVESYSSQYYKKGANEFRRLAHVEMVNLNDFSLNINHEQKTVAVTDYQPVDYMAFDVDQTLEQCKDVKIISRDKGYKIALVLNDQSTLPFNQIVLELNKQFWVETVEIFYAQKINFSGSYFKSDLAYPKLKITYNKIGKKWKDKENLLAVETYFESHRNELVLAQQFSQYQLIDFRKKQ